jgi:hypothetical protein
MDAYEVVDQRWPFDGPHSEESVTEAATAVARLVRYLNNATWPGKKHVASGPAMYRVLSNLNSTTYGLRQLLEQLRDTAATLAGDGSMYDDRRDRPAKGTAVEAASHLDSALQSLDPLIRAVERATSLTCHLGHEEARRGGDRRG